MELKKLLVGEQSRAEGSVAKKEKKIRREKQGSGFISHSKINGKIMQ